MSSRSTYPFGGSNKTRPPYSADLTRPALLCRLLAKARDFNRGIAAMSDGAIAADETVAECDDARRVLGNVGLVRHEHDADAALDVQLLKDAHHLDAGARIEVAGRLVGEQQRRVVHERARDGDALLLPARELIRMMVDAVAEADRRQRLRRALAPRGCGRLAAAIKQRQLHVLERRRARQQ